MNLRFWVAIGVLALAAVFTWQLQSQNANPSPTPDEIGEPEPAPPPLGPRHLSYTGVTRFLTEEGEIAQNAKLLLAGPARMRFQLEQSGARNVFTLSGDRAWLLQSGAEDWVEYPTETFAVETILRWEIATYPAGWEDFLKQLQAEEPWPEDAERAFSRDVPGGVLAGTLNSALELTSLEFASTRSEVPGVRVALSDWREASSGRKYPMRLTWEDGARVEEWATVQDQAFFLDATFRPPDQDTTSVHRTRPEFANDARDLGDQISLRDEVWWWMSESAYKAYPERESLEGRWWTVEGERRLALTTAPDGDEQVEFSSGQWLVWSCYPVGAWTPDPGVLEGAMQQVGVVANGPAWRMEVEQDGRRRLHTLRIPVREAD